MSRIIIALLLLVGSALIAIPIEQSRAADVTPGVRAAIVEETVQGRIAFVAPELGQVTIVSGDRRLMIQVNAETRIRLGENREGTIADLRVGWNVLCVFNTTNQRNTALVILVLGT